MTESRHTASWLAAAGIGVLTTIVGAVIGSLAFGLGFLAWLLAIGEPVAWSPTEAAGNFAVFALIGALPAFYAGLYFAGRYHVSGWIGAFEMIVAAGLSPLVAGAFAYMLAYAGAPFLVFHALAFTIFAPITIPVAIVTAAIGRPLVLRLLGLGRRAPASRSEARSPNSHQSLDQF